MCGGRGTRLGGDEKPLRRLGGRPLVDRVRAALDASGLERVYAVTSPNAPRTAAHVEPPLIETPGDGYVSDLQSALADERIDEPVLTAAADLPLLDGAVVDRVLAAADGDTLTVAVPAGRVRALGFSVDTTMRVGGVAVRPAGLNVVGEGPERTWVTRDRRLAANVNRPRDLATAPWHLASTNLSFREHKR
jgi:adenosylcobinamide-phosphate guanylyltransferase